MLYYLQFLDLGIKSYDLSKFWFKCDSKICFKICLNRGWPRGAFPLEGTASVGLGIEAVGSKGEGTVQIRRYRVGI
jgi:hypothetical protein